MRTPRRLAPVLLAATLLHGCGGHNTESWSGVGGVAPLPPPMAPSAPPPPVMAAPMPAPGAVADSAYDTEEYALLRENPFRDPSLHPLSTFGIDVDPASYANVRRFLSEGRLPPKDAVRIEELVNYFDYDYPSPAGEHPFSVTTEVAPAPWNPAHRLVHVGLQGRRVAEEELPPASLVFLLDVSGSMADHDKLPLVKTALRMLVERLREEDRVAIVVYAGAAGLVLPSTSGANRGAILEALEKLDAGGSTAGGEGIRLAYRVARESFRPGGNNRVILATDGDFNVGASSDAELVRMIEQERADGIALSVLGFGTGNVKDAKMEQLANRGNGNYAYIDGAQEARKVLVEEMGGTLLTIAKDVKVQVEFNPAAVQAYRLIGYENRLLAAEDFADDTKDAGELGAGHSVTALYEVVPVGAPSPARGADRLRYQQNLPTRRAAAGGELLHVKLRYQPPQGGASRLIEQPVRDRPTPAAASADFRFAAAVAEWGLLLRGSEFRAGASHEQVLDLARGALGADPHGYRREFVKLVEDSRRIAAVASDRPGVGTR
jgi:Ca-activated chloride channel family protein